MNLTMAAIAWLAGAVNVAETDWNKTFTNAGLMSSTGVIMVLITEDVFFAAGCGPASSARDAQTLTPWSGRPWHLPSGTFPRSLSTPDSTSLLRKFRSI